MQQVLYVILDLGWSDLITTELQHKLPQHLHCATVEAILVNPVDQVLLQLSKAVLYHLVQIWAVGGNVDEGIGIAQAVGCLLQIVNGGTIQADNVPESCCVDEQMLQPRQEAVDIVCKLLCGACLGILCVLALLGLQAATTSATRQATGKAS